MKKIITFILVATLTFNLTTFNTFAEKQESSTGNGGGVEANK